MVNACSGICMCLLLSRAIWFVDKVRIIIVSKDLISLYTNPNLMKSTFLPFLTLKPLKVSLILVGLWVLFTPALQAQSQVNDNFLTVPNGPYVSVQTAIDRLETQCKVLKGQLEVLDPATNTYKTVEAKYDYYSAILQALYDGKTVKESIVACLTALLADRYGFFTKQEKQQIKQETIALLS